MASLSRKAVSQLPWLLQIFQHLDATSLLFNLALTQLTQVSRLRQAFEMSHTHLGPAGPPVALLGLHKVTALRVRMWYFNLTLRTPDL